MIENKPPKAHGSVEWIPGANGTGKYVARLSVPGDKRRPRIELVNPSTELPLTDRVADRDLATELTQALSQRARSEALTPQAPPDKKFEVTVQEHGERWTDGTLLKEFGKINGLKVKRTVKDDRTRLRAHIYPYVGTMRVIDVLNEHMTNCLRDAEKNAIAKRKGKHQGQEWRAANRLQVYQVARRLFDLAINPCGLRLDNPVSESLKPEPDAEKAMSYLFPEELLALLGCTDVPLQRRVFYASKTYTGLRVAALLRLLWMMIDFPNRMLLSPENKGGKAQYFPLVTPTLPGYASIMNVWAAWYEYRNRPSRIAPLFDDLECAQRREATALREDLLAAGVTRDVLFMDTDTIQLLRAHDLRATFLTWARQAEMPDWWIAERTGHTSGEQMDRYHRGARVLTQLQRSDPNPGRYAPFPDLSFAIPEFRNIEPQYVVSQGGLLVPNDASRRVWVPAQARLDA